MRLPDFGDSSESVISNAQERALGDAFMREIRATMVFVDDPEVQDYIQSLGYSLVSSTEGLNLGFTFFVVQDSAINAFAAPGGYVGVNTGLILASDTESELASVIAHEVSHVTQRHIARQIELNERSNIATLAGMLAAIAIGTQNSEAGKAAAAAVIGSQAQKTLDFSRANEQEADRVGMQLLNASGFDPSAMATFFEKLQSSSRYYRRPPEYLSTHPVTTSRIAEARSRAEQYGFRQHADSHRFRMVRAKLRVLAETDTARLISELQQEIKVASPSPSPGLRYGLALAKARANDIKGARADLEALATEFPNDVSLRTSLAHVAMRAGDTAAALAILDDAYRLLPDSRLVVREYADALLQARRDADALRVLDDYRRLGELDSEMFRMRAQALAALGRIAESQADLAEHYYRRGELDAAIQQLTLASRHPDNDFYRASRIEARLDQIRGEQAARARR